MKKIGFIGYGSMGRMLIKGLIEYSKISPDIIIVTRKDKEKLNEIKEEWPEINIAADAYEVAEKADYIFLCVKPMEYKNIMLGIKYAITPDHHIISITGAVTIKDIESIINCKITKLMPTVISEVREGVTLICHNQKVSNIDKEFLEGLLMNFTHLYSIEEENFGFASEITSCGPGLYSAILQEFVEAGFRHSDRLSKEELVKLVAQTVYGTAKLMLEKDMNFTEVISRVATKGGITQEGVKVAQAGLPQIFDEMFDRTMEKRKLVAVKINSQFLDS